MVVPIKRRGEKGEKDEGTAMLYSCIYNRLLLSSFLTYKEEGEKDEGTAMLYSCIYNSLLLSSFLTYKEKGEKDKGTDGKRHREIPFVAVVEVGH